MRTQESPEDYLESIYMIIKQNGDVRSVDIANHFGYTKASVSVAMKKLRESGHINMDRYGKITLTESGENIATRVYERHEVITAFLKKLGIDEKTAENDACRMEHIVSEETFQKFKEYVNS
jgi:Mn-dependent DtxR family transcriptional regulator